MRASWLGNFWENGLLNLNKIYNFINNFFCHFFHHIRFSLVISVPDIFYVVMRYKDRSNKNEVHERVCSA